MTKSADAAAKRTKQVLELHGQGLAVKAIAERLHISDVTVRNHLNRAGLCLSRAIELPAHRLRELYQSGQTIKDLALLFGCSADTVRRSMISAGISRRSIRIAKGGFPESQDEQVIQLYKQGFSSTRLAEDYGVTYQTILNVLRRHDVTIRPPGSLTEKLAEAVSGKGRFSRGAPAVFYLFHLKGYPEVVKPGVTADLEKRVAYGTHYGSSIETWGCAERVDAWLTEQAFLAKTAKHFIAIPALGAWPGRSEVRAMSASRAIELAENLKGLLEGMGRWSFAREHVAKTDLERRMCAAAEGAVEREQQAFPANG